MFGISLGDAVVMLMPAMGAPGGAEIVVLLLIFGFLSAVIIVGVAFLAVLLKKLVGRDDGANSGQMPQHGQEFRQETVRNEERMASLEKRMASLETKLPEQRQEGDAQP